MSKQLDPLGTTAPELPSIEQYKEIYSNRKPWEEETWLKKCLPFSDAMPAMCYAHDISWDTLTKSFSEVFSPGRFYDSLKGKNWPNFDVFLKQDFFNDYPSDIVAEICDSSRWNLYHDIMDSNLWIGKNNRHTYTLDDQINFINANKKRQPKNVLEIGSGVGVFSNTISQLGAGCISVDIAKDHKNLMDLTAKFYFDLQKTKVVVKTNCISLEIQTIDLAEIDTIVMIESIEHIPKKRFDIVWQEICKNFQGRFIVTNWLDYHPIEVSDVFHCRQTDDDFYDLLTQSATTCWHRDRSHLVLDF